jgi:tetratricopeptide (TPR) repeat protein
VIGRPGGGERKATAVTAALTIVAAGLALFGVPLALGFMRFAWVAPLMLGSALLVAIAALLGSSQGGDRRRGRSVLFGSTLLVAGALLPRLLGVPLDVAFYDDRLAIALAALAIYLGAGSAFASPAGIALRRTFPRLLLLALAMHLVAGGYRYFALSQDRMSGLLFNPNLFASLVAALGVPGYVAARAMRRKGLPVVIAAGIATSVLLSGSRAALALAIAALLACEIAVRAGRRATPSAVARWIPRVGIVLASLLTVVLLTPNPLTRRLSGDLDRSFPRTFIWKTSAGIALEHPLGIGLGMHEYYFAPRAFVPEEPTLSHRRNQIGVAHNVFLGAATETGVLGAAGLAWLVLRLAWLAITHRRRFARPRTLGLLVATALLLAHAQFDAVAQNTASLLALVWLAAALELALRPRRAAIAARRCSWRSIVAFVLALVACAAGARASISRISTQEAAALARGGDLDAARRSFLAILAGEPRTPSAAAELFALERRRYVAASSSDRAFLDLEAAARARIAANAMDPGGWLALGDARRTHHFSSGRTDQALLAAAARAYDAGLAIDPLELSARLALARVLVLLRQPEAAALHLERLLAIEPKHPPALFTFGELEAGRGRLVAALRHHERAAEAYFEAMAVLTSGKYGSYPYLAAIVEGFDPQTNAKRIRDLSR